MDTVYDGYHRQCIRRTYVIISICTQDHASHGIGRKTVFLIQHIDDLVIGTDGHASVICTNPKTSLCIGIQTVDIAHTVKMLHPDKICSVIFV